MNYCGLQYFARVLVEKPCFRKRRRCNNRQDDAKDCFVEDDRSPFVQIMRGGRDSIDQRFIPYNLVRTECHCNSVMNSRSCERTNIRT